jgi:hypothetical protein
MLNIFSKNVPEPTETAEKFISQIAESLKAKGGGPA